MPISTPSACAACSCARAGRSGDGSATVALDPTTADFAGINAAIAGQDFLDALELVHANKSWHLDVSPENIMVTYAGMTKLVDFGVAKTAASMSKTRAGVLKGKVAYMAPEQLRSPTVVDRRTDVFALGVVLYELTTGKRPFDAESELENLLRAFELDPSSALAAASGGAPRRLSNGRVPAGASLAPETITGGDARSFIAARSVGHSGAETRTAPAAMAARSSPRRSTS